MLDRVWDTLVRWRTWIVNILFGAIITPEVVLVLMGFDWGAIIPAEYMPFVTLALAVCNVWMRPRKAARGLDRGAQT